MYYLIRKSREEEGAIALMVLVFMMTAGVATILTLWSIGSITGAYNKLYIANQAAAYSAATTASHSDVGSYQQLAFNCGGVQGDTSVCGPGDRTFDVANNVFGKTLINSSGYGGFGLRYNPNNLPSQNISQNPNSAVNTAQMYATANHSSDTSGGFSIGGGSNINNALETFEIASTPAQAKLKCESINSGSNVTHKESNGSIVCWRLIEGGITFPWQYTTGVVTRARAVVPKIPGLCSIAVSQCRITLNVKAAASLNQTTAPSDFNSYLVNP